jgi:peptide/nickel transport system ATP-binding protein
MERTGAIRSSGTVQDDAPVLEAVNVTKYFPVHGDRVSRRFGERRVVHAVEDASLSLYSGRVTALVGESGSGKSTLARILAGLYRVTSGQVLFRSKPVTPVRGKGFRQHVGDVQLILQDPYGAFNPMLRVSRDLQRALHVHEPRLKGNALADRMGDLLGQVKLEPPAQFLEKYPHELSGGQLQRVSIARALAAQPSVILADEPVSNLDVSIRLGVLNLLAELAAERRAALLYVTHDVASARYFATETAVMYAGELIERGPSEEITSQPAHPYTRLLISSAPDPARQAGSERARASGQPPSLVRPPTGCRFHPRCPFAMDRCRTEQPPRFEIAGSHWARCFLYAEATSRENGTTGGKALN